MLVIQFGPHKSASSYCSQLLHEILKVDYPDATLKFSNLNRISLEKLPESADGSAHVVKTHGAPGPELADAARRGDVRIVLTSRDPRDIVLSLIDAGRKRRDRGQLKNTTSKIHGVEDAIPLLLRDLGRLEKWRQIEALELPFASLTADPHDAIDRMAAHLGKQVDAGRVAATFADPSRINKFNKGRTSLRWPDEMSAADQEKIMSAIRKKQGEEALSWFLPRPA